MQKVTTLGLFSFTEFWENRKKLQNAKKKFEPLNQSRAFWESRTCSFHYRPIHQPERTVLPSCSRCQLPDQYYCLLVMSVICCFCNTRNFLFVTFLVRLRYSLPSSSLPAGPQSTGCFWIIISKRIANNSVFYTRIRFLRLKCCQILFVTQCFSLGIKILKIAEKNTFPRLAIGGSIFRQPWRSNRICNIQRGSDKSLLQKLDSWLK